MFAYTNIGSYLFEDDRGGTVNVTAQRYARMVSNFFSPALVCYPVNEDTFFQGIGVTSHTADAKIHNN